MPYTANLDGTELRRFGTMPGPPEEVPSKAEPVAPGGEFEPGPPDRSFGAEWMPDGRTICFIAEGRIYLVEDR